MREVTYTLTLSDPMDWSLPGSSIHWIFQARVLEWVAVPFSRGSPLVRPVFRGTFGVALRVPNIISHLKTERGTTLETLERARASSCNDGGTTWFFSS